MDEKNALLRHLPAIERVLNEPELLALADQCPRALLVEAAQQAVATLRAEIVEGGGKAPPDCSPAAVARRAAELARERLVPSLQRVINASGTLLHTNLGRAPLSERALAAIEEVSRSYSNLEFDLATGERGHRSDHVENLLCRLTGAEAATVVNNNAGAVLLALTAMAKGREAIVSRGELVEIGGAFRIPEVMAAGGVRLREVGSTNKTRLADYRAALGEETGLLLKVHTSNYRIVGFTETVSGADLAALGREKGIPVMEDLGSGLLFDLSAFGLPREPTVSEALAAGIDVVTFSGDKLLGGPQAGLIVGKKEVVGAIRRHPMARALRSDKLTLAALEATLRHYLDREEAIREIPVLRMMALSAEELHERCRHLAKKLGPLVEEDGAVEVVPEASRIGGGALPLAELPGYAVALALRTVSADTLARRLRQGAPPVVGRIQEERLLLNPRTLAPREDAVLVEAVRAALRAEG